MVEIGAPTPIGPFFEDRTVRRNYYTFYVRGFQAIRYRLILDLFWLPTDVSTGSSRWSFFRVLDTFS